MKTIFLFFAIFIVIQANAGDSDVVNCNKSFRLIILGSSTAYGTGASITDSSFVAKYRAYIKRKNPLNDIINYGIPGYRTYHNLRPTGYIPPSDRPFPNTEFNITNAFLDNPDAVIINMPSNDAVSNYTLVEQQANFEATMRIADSLKIPVWVTTSQPRFYLTTDQMTNLRDFRTWVLSRFANKAVDFWDGIANENGTIAAQYYYDYVHVNNAGHEEFYNRLKKECILDTLANRYLGKLIVIAGNDTTLNLPTTSYNLQGSATTTNTTLSSFNWNKISGPAHCIFSAPTSLTNQVSNLIRGNYLFELVVSDTKNNIVRDTISISVICGSSSTTYSTTNVSICSYSFPYFWNNTNYYTIGTYTKTITNYLGCDSVATLNIALASCPVFSFTVKAIIEGYYNNTNLQMMPILYDLNQTTDSTITDSVCIKIWHPDDLVDSMPSFSCITFLNKNGNAIVSIPINLSGGFYYISINHKNSLETWSANTVRLISNSTYDFSNSLSKAYNNGINTPMKFISSDKYAIFSGDVNQDGSINLVDLQQAENSAKFIGLGYLNDDLNGDGVVDIFDLQIIDNNKILFLNKARP
jgi:lysophospholipase L1-like esterase